MSDNVPAAGGQGAPPGWYPDPWQQADERWWTGFEWTDGTRQAPHIEQDKAEGRGAKLLAAVVGVLLVGALVSTLTGTGPDEVDPPAAQDTQPADEPEPAPPQTSVSLEGGGEVESDPFRLDAGHYRVSWTAPGDCYYGFVLKPLDGQWPQQDLASPGDREAGEDNVYGVEGGRWYLKVFTGPAPNCPWTLTLEPR